MTAKQQQHVLILREATFASVQTDLLDSVPSIAPVSRERSLNVHHTTLKVSSLILAVQELLKVLYATFNVIKRTDISTTKMERLFNISTDVSVKDLSTEALQYVIGRQGTKSNACHAQLSNNLHGSETQPITSRLPV